VHELDTTPGHDEGLEAVRTQVVEQLEHGLIDHLGEELAGLGMLRRGDPIGDGLSNSSVVMPAWVAANISTMAFSPPAATAFMSPFSSEEKGSFSFHSGSCGASAFTRSTAKKAWEYIGCSAQSVPSLSNVAMRSAAGTKFAEPSFVTFSTNWRIACLAVVSFQDGNGSDAHAGARRAAANAME
jgi:hypothetical protein